MWPDVPETQVAVYGRTKGEDAAAAKDFPLRHRDGAVPDNPWRPC